MGRRKDLVGKRFGRLTVLCRAKDNTNDGHPRWVCMCDCGREVIVPGRSLQEGKTKSCGCYRKEVKLMHGDARKRKRTRLYNIWVGIKSRCLTSSCSEWEYYGGRGIAICDEWKDSYASFREWALSNGYDDTLTIDRIDNDGDYTPGNCRWVNRKAQVRNTKRAIHVMVDGIDRLLSDVAEENGISASVAHKRVTEYGWRPEEAALIPSCHGMLSQEDRIRVVRDLRAGRVAEPGKLYEAAGYALTLKTWSRVSGVPWNILYYRLKAGWNVQTAVSVPLLEIGKKANAGEKMRYVSIRWPEIVGKLTSEGILPTVS